MEYTPIWGLYRPNNSNSIVGQEIANHLAENLVEDYKLMAYFFPNKSFLIIETEEGISRVAYILWWGSAYP